MNHTFSKKECKVFMPKTKLCEAHLPQNNTLYATAKKAHVVEKDLKKAEHYYKLAIKNGEKVASSIKDLSNIYHQQGRTQEALDFLQTHQHLCKSSKHIDNLIETFKKQIVPTGNYLNKTLVLFNLALHFDSKNVGSLFENDSRIEDIMIIEGKEVDKILNNYQPLKDHFFEKPIVTLKRACLIKFSSNSAARKTLDTMKDSNTYQFYWLNEDNKLVRKAEPYRKKLDDSLSEDLSEGSTAESHHSNASSGSAKSCWQSFVFPALEDEDQPINLICPVVFESKALPATSQLWHKIDVKLAEARTMVDNDPEYVKKLLNKVIVDDCWVA